jgi:hypothetical protein
MAAALLILERVGAHDERAGGVLLDRCRDGAELLLGLEVRHEHAPPEEPRDPDEQRVRRHDPQGQDRIDGQHDRDRTQVQYRRLDDVQNAHPQEQTHAVDVVHGAGHQVTRAGGVEERLRQALKLAEEVVAELVLDLATGAEHDDPRRQPEAGEHHRDTDQPGDRTPDRRPAGIRLDRAQDVAHREGHRLEDPGVG